MTGSLIWLIISCWKDAFSSFLIHCTPLVSPNLITGGLDLENHTKTGTSASHYLPISGLGSHGEDGIVHELCSYGLLCLPIFSQVCEFCLMQELGI